jgi:hypothetical protein
LFFVLWPLLYRNHIAIALLNGGLGERARLGRSVRRPAERITVSFRPIDSVDTRQSFID